MNLAESGERPPPGTNNVWFEYNSSDTLFVFVHGILSDSRDAWYYEGDAPKNSAYWPTLVATTEEFNNPSIFLGGFYTEVRSGDYTIRDAANELFEYLSVSVSPAGEPALSKTNIVFVAHSLGGIVVRHILTREQEAFKDKNVGIVLVASPSIGSKDADRLDFAIDLANQKMAKGLKWKNATLVNLDKDFRNLVDRNRGSIVGLEAIENHFYKKNLFGFRTTVLVEEESGGRYFGAPIRISDTDHSSIAKPRDSVARMHIALRNFYESKFLPMAEETPRSYDTSRIRAADLPDIEEIRSLFMAIHQEYKRNFIRYLALVDQGGDPQEVEREIQDVNALTADDRGRLVRLVKKYDDLDKNTPESDALMGLIMRYFGIPDANYTDAEYEAEDVFYQRWRKSIGEDIQFILSENWNAYFDRGASRPPKSDWKPEIRSEWESIRRPSDKKFDMEKFKEYLIRKSISSNLQQSQRLAIKIEEAIDELAASSVT